MEPIYIAGIAMTEFGRHPDRSLQDMALEALNGALADARAQRSDIGAVFYAGITNGQLQGQLSIPGQVVCSKIGIEGVPIYNVENACASGSTAVHLAVQSLRAGATDVALALGAEKMVVPDKMKTLALFEAGWDVSTAEENYATLVRMGEGIVLPAGSESDRPADVRTDDRRRCGRDHLHRGGPEAHRCRPQTLRADRRQRDSQFHPSRHGRT